MMGQFLAWMKNGFGGGVGQDNEGLVRGYRMAAEQGDPEAQYNLGVMYGGNGVKEDPPKAAYWMRKAAEQGHKFALSNLALMYREGKGVAKDLTVAHMMYGLSGKAGNIDALKIQKEISAKMSSSQIRKSNKLAESWKIGAALPVR